MSHFELLETTKMIFFLEIAGKCLKEQKFKAFHFFSPIFNANRFKM